MIWKSTAIWNLRISSSSSRPPDGRSRGLDKLSVWSIRLAEFHQSRFTSNKERGRFREQERPYGIPARYARVYSWWNSLVRDVPCGVYDHTVPLPRASQKVYLLRSHSGHSQDALAIAWFEMMNILTLFSSKRHCFHATRSQDELRIRAPSRRGRHLDTFLRGLDDVVTQGVSRSHPQSVSYLRRILWILLFDW